MADQNEQTKTTVSEHHNILAKAIGLVFHRMTITVLLIIFQFFFAVFMLLAFSDYAGWVEAAMSAFGFFVIVLVVWSSEHPAYKIGWMFLIVLMPAAGALLYILYGRKRTTRSLQRRITAQESAHKGDLDQVLPYDRTGDERPRTTARYVQGVGSFPAWENT